jgi:hypothetical protein
MIKFLWKRQPSRYILIISCDVYYWLYFKILNLNLDIKEKLGLPFCNRGCKKPKCKWCPYS